MTKRIFTAALAVWLSGIVLVICCKMPTANAAGAAMESCPLAKKSDCEKSAQESSGESFENESQTFDCCTFPAKVFDKARKIEVQPPPTIISETIETVAPKIFSFQKTFSFPQVYQSFTRNRGSTHLQNCVFRI